MIRHSSVGGPFDVNWCGGLNQDHEGPLAGARLLACDTVVAQEEMLFQVHVLHEQLPLKFGSDEWKQAQAEFFQKPQACLHASPLPKQYGWGLHFDDQGRVALVARESPRYAELASGLNGSLTVRPAMRSKRAGT